MKNTQNFPMVIKKNRIIFAQKDCKDAILVQVHHGTNQLRFEASGAFDYQVTIGGKNLFDVDGTYGCPTCGGNLIRGY